MKTYILTIISAAVLSAFAINLSPEKWKKYIQLVTGLVVIICILSPIKSIITEDIFGDMADIDYSIAEGVSQAELVKEELKSRVEDDAKKRLLEEFGINASVSVEISVNDSGEIEGVKKISVSGARLTAAAKARLCEVYGVSEVYDE